MRKIIETERKSLIVCDNLKCDYEVPFSREEEKMITKYINKPCPLCGENLLTEQDNLQDKKLIKIVDFINKWFSWITIFYSKKSLENPEIVSVHIHDRFKIKKEK